MQVALQALIEAGADIEARNDIEQTPLHQASYSSPSSVKVLIEAGADVNKPVSARTVDAYGTLYGVVHNATPMYASAQEGHTHVVMELIKAGADLNQANSNDATPLYIAAQNGHEAIAALLIQAGADVRKAVKSGYTPMQIATDEKREKVVTLLKFYERV